MRHNAEGPVTGNHGTTKPLQGAEPTTAAVRDREAQRTMRRIHPLIFITMLAACASPSERAADYLANAQRFYEQGDFVKAELEAKNAAQIEPKNAEARYLLALIAEQKRDFRRVIGNLQVALDSDPTMVKARIKLGTLYFFAQAFDESSEQAAAALEIAPDDAAVRILNARLLLQRDQREAALAEVAIALELEPDNVDAIILQAAVYAEQEPDRALEFLDEGIARLTAEDAERIRNIKLAILAGQDRPADVERELRSLIESSPEDQSYQVQLARLYTAQGRVDEAEDLMRTIASSDREDVAAKLGLVQFLNQVRTPEAAEDVLQTFVEEDPGNQQLRLALGELLDTNGRVEQAVAVYKEIARLDPKSEYGLLARNQLVTHLLRAEDLVGARELIESILQDDPDNSEALLMRAGILFTNARYSDAVADLRTVLQRDAESQKALLLLGRTHMRAGDAVLAKDAYRRLLEVDPAHPDANRELVALSVRDGELAEAEALLRRSAEANADDVDAGTRLVEVLAIQEKWEAAETEARRLAATEDPDGAGRFQLARVLEGQGRHSEAAEEFRQVLNKNPKSLPALQGLTRSLSELGRWEEAVDYLRRHLEVYPDEAGARLLLGGVFASQGKRTEAAWEFKAAIAANPDVTAGYLALARLDPDDPPARIEAYRSALDAIPANPEISLLLASEYERLARYDEAIEVYEMLVTASPDLAVAKNNLAALLLDFRYQEEESLRRAVTIAEELSSIDNPAVLDTVGWAYYRAGEHAKAVSYLERAAAAASQVPQLRYHLGMAYLAADNPLGAEQELDKALQLAKGDFVGIEEARATLAALQEG